MKKTTLFLEKFFLRTAFSVIAVFAVISIFAPLLASNKPYIAQEKDGGKILFPLFINYPQLADTDFRNDESFAFKIFPPVKYSSTEYDLDGILVSPSKKHFFGTDEQGRDIAARMIHGSRNSFFISLFAVAIYISIGIAFGAVAGFFGGLSDMLISRVIEVMICFPVLFLILAVISIIGPSLLTIMGIIGLTGWTSTARLVRGEFFRLKASGFVTAAKSCGAGNFRIITRHILPNALTPVMISAIFGLASAILIESSLSFLGFGIQPPLPSWGDILSQSREFFDIAWWLAVIPGSAIFLVISSYNIIGRYFQKKYESSKS